MNQKKSIGEKQPELDTRISAEEFKDDVMNALFWR